ncbi:MAG: hypothetical protein CR991_03905 [Proteobacteria bacterium]|nr:MAG: hypothetical protein CR991_03905 [Pseudomonadota bacterium]
MFEKTKVALGVTMGILGLAGIATTAQAVHVNPDGTGQVLIFPYYNAHSGYVTNVNLINSTDETKAVKIRFREGTKSNDVLDFNIYMSPQDVWTGSVRMTQDDSGVEIGSVSTRDRTCTLPQLASCKEDACEVTVPFTGHTVYKGITATDTLEGYIEVIEMGVVTDSTVQQGVLHTRGTPNNCSAVEQAWVKNVFQQGVGANATGLSAPTGGLFGSSAVLNIAEGAAYAVDPTAIENYSTVAQHYLSHDPDNFLLPSLASGNVMTSNIMVKNNMGTTDMVETTWKATEDACLNDGDDLSPRCGTNPYPVAHVLLAEHLMNEYFLDPSDGYDGHTDWIVTFPMKKHGIHAGQTDVTMSMSGVYDREEAVPNVVADRSFGFSPVLPGREKNEEGILSREVNVLSFLSSDPAYDDSRTVMSSHTGNTLSVGAFVHGWARMSFPGYSLASGWQSATPYGKSTSTYDANSSIYRGVPVIGFAAIEGNVSANPHARFGDAIPHRISRTTD